MNEKNRNLAVRIATAVVLLPAVLWLLWQGGWAFALLVSAAAALCAVELNLMPQDAGPPPNPGGVVASAGAAFLLPLLAVGPVGMLSAPGVLSALVVIAFADALLFEPEVSRAPLRVGLAVLGAVYPGLLMSALVRLRQLDRGVGWIVLCLTVTWLNDTGAYFTGRAFGRHKLYPRISPSKTWEGAAGGLLASVAGALAVKHLFLSDLPVWAAAVVGVGGGILGPLGDLSESMIKRAFGRKDSSRLLPGHGGILDRIDALLFNAPFVWLCARLLLESR
jgi:phosphatidate cytidylyltransferase